MEPEGIYPGGEWNDLPLSVTNRKAQKPTRIPSSDALADAKRRGETTYRSPAAVILGLEVNTPKALDRLQVAGSCSLKDVGRRHDELVVKATCGESPLMGIEGVDTTAAVGVRSTEKWLLRNECETERESLVGRSRLLCNWSGSRKE